MRKMSKKTIFTGSAVAIITPFRNGAVDYEALGNIIEAQIEGKTDAIVICGTTGECATLTDQEHRLCIEYTLEKVNHRVPVIAGTGSNDTAYAVELSKHAASAGADGLLLVTPYYNKATPKGLIKHFTTIAESVDIPSIVYNVPSRTGCNVTIPVYKELAKCDNISGIKEASGNISQIAQLLESCQDSFDVYSGNDDQIVPILSLGGKGVISVLANVMPREAHDICQLYFDGKVKESAALQLRLLELCNTLFCEVNPIPVKTAMAALGYCAEEFRLPMCEMEDGNKEKLYTVLRKVGLLK
jgi:4-hydroxy-tetrahydrodipicolinate synthase